MDNITNKCSGCRACEKVCPKGCISMREDKEGFLNPFIDNTVCVSCGLCRSSCPQNKVFVQEYEKLVYAAKAKSKDVLMNSSSGGAFYVFAKHTIEKGGVVFGAAYRDDFSVEHVKAESLEELKALQGSKYVQSDTANTYVACENCLRSGQFVLYTGTPCQIAGLNSYLKKSYDNLLTIEIICHGVPSGKLFKKYIQWLSDKHGSKVIGYDFRTKKGKGWGTGYNYSAKTETDEKKGPGIADPYYSRFLKGSIYRKCCYECRYANENRMGDVTIGDFWGIEKYHPHFYDSKGVSVIIVNTEIGEKHFNNIKDDIEYIVSDFNTAAKKNKSLVEPTGMPAERNYIFKEIDDLSNNKYFKKYFHVSVQLKLKAALKAVLPARLIILLKSLI